jgi:hypothetical protein
MKHQIGVVIFDRCFINSHNMTINHLERKYMWSLSTTDLVGPSAKAVWILAYPLHIYLLTYLLTCMIFKWW